MSEKSSIPASWDPERNFLDSFRSSRHLPEQQRPDSPGLSMSEKSKLPTPRPASAEISPRWRFFESSRSLRLTTSSVQSRDDPINFKESSSLRRRVLGFFWSSRRP